MKKFSNILAIMALGLLGAACSDDLKAPQVETPADDELVLTLEVPAQQIVQSRANQNDGETNIGTLRVYLFNSGNTLLEMLETNAITKSTAGDITTVTAKVRMTDASLSVNNKKVYIVANAPDGLTRTPAGWVFRTAQTVYVNNNTTSNGGLTMVAGIEGGVTSGRINATLTRLASKVTVESGSGVTDYTITGFTLCNGKNNIALVPKTATEGAFHTGAVGDRNGTLTTPVYVAPTAAATDATDDGAYVIIKATATGSTQETYYRLNLKNNDGPVDLLSNHWVKINVTAINAPGYANIDEAKANPETDGSRISADITDHAANVLTMVSDGERELGASNNIEWVNQGTNTLRVKVYSPVAADMDASNISVEVVEGSAWLSVDPTPKEEQYSTEGEKTADWASFTDQNPGKLYSFTLEGADIYSSNDATLRVSWKGLSRDVIVNRTVTFTPEEICYATLNIYSSPSATTTNAVIGNYWAFIAKKGKYVIKTEPNTEKADNEYPILYGVSASDMGTYPDGKTTIVRDRGLHFPFLYGSNAKYRYEYVLSIRGQVDTVVPKVVGDPIFAGCATYDPASKTVTVKLTDPEVETYATGNLKLQIKTKTGENDINIGLYHTGFFHFVGLKGYYYYEVIPMGGTYWLDRNVGAKSRRNYVEYANSSESVGNSDAAGEYYKIAEAKTLYQLVPDRKVIVDIPEGWHIPTKTEFDKVRTSPQLTTASVVDDHSAAFATYYDAGDEMGYIYFPKARFLNSGTKAGSDAAGYYWTFTPSSGLEKQQIGQWLRALCFSGSTNSYINAQVEVPNGSKLGSGYYTDGYQMNIRAAYGYSAPPEVSNTIAFNVQGATHVFIYEKDGNNRSPLFAFPGKAVSTAAAADSKAVNVTYTTSSDPGSIYMFFVHVSASGAITTIGSTVDADNPINSKGWKYVQGATYTVNRNSSSVSISGGTLQADQ